MKIVVNQIEESSQAYELNYQDFGTSQWKSQSPELASYQQTYHEIADEHVVEADVLDRLQVNVARLKSLSSRMEFMMSEVKGIMKV